jgi:hypothetical protein
MLLLKTVGCADPGDTGADDEDIEVLGWEHGHILAATTASRKVSMLNINP